MSTHPSLSTHLTLYLVDCRMPMDEQQNLTSNELTDFSIFVWSAHPDWVLPTWKRFVLQELVEWRIDVLYEMGHLNKPSDPTLDHAYTESEAWYTRMAFEDHATVSVVPTEPPPDAEGAAAIVHWDTVRQVHPPEGA